MMKSIQVLFMIVLSLSGVPSFADLPETGASISTESVKSFESGNAYTRKMGFSLGVSTYTRFIGEVYYRPSTHFSLALGLGHTVFDESYNILNAQLIGRLHPFGRAFHIGGGVGYSRYACSNLSSGYSSYGWYADSNSVQTCSEINFITQLGMTVIDFGGVSLGFDFGVVLRPSGTRVLHSYYSGDSVVPFFNFMKIGYMF